MQRLSRGAIKTGKLVIYPASGKGPDLVARLFVERFSKVWNQQVTVEARLGANGFIAFEAIKKGTPDGHDLAIARVRPAPSHRKNSR